VNLAEEKEEEERESKGPMNYDSHAAGLKLQDSMVKFKAS